MLYVPATAEKFLAKAAGRGADGILVDLEDSIPPTRKSDARAALPSAVEMVRAGQTDGKPDILVRINRPWRLAVQDLEAAVIDGVDGLCLPKVDSADHLIAIDEVVAELEAERGLPFGKIMYFVLVETAKGVSEARAIAKASRRVCGITLGGEDLAADLGLPDADPAVLAPYNAEILLAAREAGVLPMGYPGSIAEFTDLQAFRAAAEQGRREGFEGGACIHPVQVAILNAAFAPSPEEIAHAEGVMAAFEASLAKGEGAVAYQGKMIDKPIVDRARRVLEKSNRLCLL
jgi:citrate lyase subunit beta/citryl-CoA lyase